MFCHEEVVIIHILQMARRREREISCLKPCVKSVRKPNQVRDQLSPHLPPPAALNHLNLSVFLKRGPKNHLHTCCFSSPNRIHRLRRHSPGISILTTPKILLGQGKMLPKNSEGINHFCAHTMCLMLRSNFTYTCH